MGSFINSKSAVYNVEGLRLVRIYWQCDADTFLRQVVRVLLKVCNITKYMGLKCNIRNYYSG